MTYQNLTLTEYLRIRHPTVNALTHAEANILGIPYPLQTGWVGNYSDDIPHEKLVELLAAREKRYSSEAYKKSKVRKAKKHKPKTGNSVTIKSLANKLIKNGNLSKKENEQLLFMQFSNKKTR